MIIKEIEVQTRSRVELIDITAYVEKVVKESGVSEGVCVIYIPHTTAAVTINENADPSVKEDIITKLSQLIPAGESYHHKEGNADAHIKATVVGSSETIVVKGGGLLVGTWQGVFFCEFDGPRRRRVIIRVF
jgi:secondary thiamine-phosphate synthase enzyme